MDGSLWEAYAPDLPVAVKIFMIVTTASPMTHRASVPSLS